MTTKFAKRWTSVLAGVAILVLGAIVAVVWVQFNQGAFRIKQQHQVFNASTAATLSDGPKHLNRSRHKEYIEKTHLEDLGQASDEEFVKPLKIGPLPLHNHDIIYNRLHNNHENPVLRHHSGHFRHRQAEVWDPHPQYDIDAFGRKFHLELGHDSKFVASDLQITTHIQDNHTQRVRHDPKMSGCFYTGKVRGDAASSVSVSLCHGMTGYILTSESTYYIEPAEKFFNDTLGSVIHRMKRLPHPPKDTNEVAFDFDDFRDSSENRTIIEDDYEIVERYHKREKREITDDEQTESDYINTCDIDTEKDDDLLVDEISRTTREIEWNTYAKMSKEYFMKVLVVADQTLMKYHTSDEDVEHYILTLMSHVALLFKDASIGNAISLAVVHIVILRNKDFSNTNSQDMLRKFCEWQQLNIKYPHDVALLLTRNAICKNATPKACATLGVADVGSICRPSSCAIVRDKGLSTSYTIAHELGHALSMPHDEDRKCEAYNKRKQNNIMNKTLKKDTKPFMWSPCSRHILTEFLDSKKAKCLNNPPTKDWIPSSYTKKLPGDVFEVDRQCELEFGPGSRVCPFIGPCEHLWCTSTNGEDGCKTQWSPWAEGTKCGENSWCFHRQCIPQDREQFTPIDGGWGPWQEWGPCSRTCGGGIQTSQRYCNSPEPINGGNYCTGESVRYASCNTMDCEAGVEDFRAVQCAKFNGDTMNLPDLTSSVEWIPKYGLEQVDDMCRLYCRTKGSNSYYMLRDKVIDGTKCGLTSFDICVNGECKPGGCDNKLESRMSWDDCGICGGDNSHCQEISGSYNNQAETSGYNRIIRIPKGSSNLYITQDPHPYPNDENYLVLIDGETDKYILNGEYMAVTHQTEVVFGFLVIKYSGAMSGVEWIKTPKNQKLTKDLVLAVLSVGNLTPPNITYRYVIGKDEAPSYGWVLYQTEWSKCNSICEGKQFREPVCIELSSGKEVHRSYCDPKDDNGKKQQQDCNTHCELTWNVAFKGACSKQCGEGIRRVHYNCMKVHKKKPNHSEIVNDKHCNILGEPPRTESCISACNSIRWHYSNWTECSKPCGGGLQTRTAKCVDYQNTIIDDSYCTNSEMITEQICNTEVCPSWTVAETSSCSAPCGGGYQSITYYCVVDGRIDPDACDINTRPPTRKPCNEQACGRWAPLNTYSACSVTCGEGYERKQFVCKKFNSEEILHEDYCRDLTVPNESRVCFRGSCDKMPSYDRSYNRNNDYDNSINPEKDMYHNFMWSPVNWSPCSQTCGVGITTEIFHCVNGVGQEDHLMCDINSKPKNVRQCNTMPCPKWKTSRWNPTCDHKCERNRQVVCKNFRNMPVHDSQCDQTQKPVNLTKCQVSECHHLNPTKRYRWKVGHWKECSNTCGKGTRRRYIECEDVVNNVTVVDSLCRHMRKPKATKPCERYNCKYAWIESYWSACSATCGTGIKTREVNCHKIHNGGIVDPNPLPDIFLNKIYHKNYCSLYDKPKTRMKCVESYCGDQYVWEKGPWKQCSQKCGRKGRQERMVSCVEATTRRVVPPKMCPRKLRPPKKRKCNERRCLYKSCKEVKHFMRTNDNKDYYLSVQGRPVQIYCYKMDTPEPQEYISLYPDTMNYAEIYDKRLTDIRSCPYNGERRDNCQCDQIGTDRSGFTNFWKVRLNVTSMKIIGDDFTFSKQLKGRKIPYGTAGDCYSSVRDCAQGRFSIDLTHTSFKLARNVRWEEIGSYASSVIHRRETVTSGKCGGYCGNCIPHPDIGLAVEIT